MSVTSKEIFKALEILRDAFPEKRKGFECEIATALAYGFDLSVLKLSRRTETVLRGHGINMTRKLTHSTGTELDRLFIIPGIGRKSLDEIRAKVREFSSV